MLNSFQTPMCLNLDQGFGVLRDFGGFRGFRFLTKNKLCVTLTCHKILHKDSINSMTHSYILNLSSG